ncbi:Fibrinogen C domain-containing protein 1 [Folsomia candida]|uniref:Fibrinogen C domain-containing protein 1 n=1 Tax=Folsomia candida TaxID=158441 RepID=A0A226CVQ3_FOLCA|nr:Fibrinogen C domain-containing protein 1 [Folsomia candida]
MGKMRNNRFHVLVVLLCFSNFCESTISECVGEPQRDHFYRNWTEYEVGFGNRDRDFWLGDSLAYHLGNKFSTFDRDNDNTNHNCAERYMGAWWFNNCFLSHLNGEYKNSSTTISNGGLIWSLWTDWGYSLKACEMKIIRNN